MTELELWSLVRLAIERAGRRHERRSSPTSSPARGRVRSAALPENRAIGDGRARPRRSRPAPRRLLGRLLRDVRGRRAVRRGRSSIIAWRASASSGSSRRFGLVRSRGTSTRSRAAGSRLPAPFGARSRRGLARGAADRPRQPDRPRGGHGGGVRARLVRRRRGSSRRAGRPRHARRLRRPLGPRARAVRLHEPEAGARMTVERRRNG